MNCNSIFKKSYFYNFPADPDQSLKGRMDENIDEVAIRLRDSAIYSQTVQGYRNL